MEIGPVIVAIVVLLALLVVAQMYGHAEGFASDSCAGLDERGCRNTIGCGWCIDDNGYGSCKIRPDSKCAQWSRSIPADADVDVVPVVPPSYFYYPSYWWRGPGSRDWRKARERRRHGGW